MSSAYRNGQAARIHKGRATADSEFDLRFSNRGQGALPAHFKIGLYTTRTRLFRRRPALLGWSPLLFRQLFRVFAIFDRKRARKPATAITP